MTDVTEPGVDLDADRAIMAFVRDSRRGRDLKRIGQFLLMFTATTRHRYLNYAIPDDNAAPSRAELDQLVDAFHAGDRTHASSSCQLWLHCSKHASWTTGSRWRSACR